MTSKIPTALLVIDFVNPLLPTNGKAYVAAALAAARHTARLLRAARDIDMPVIYANDNFGNWRSDFPSLVRECTEHECGLQVLELLHPGEGDYTMLKPRHSAFYGTPLEFLLDELGVSRLILTGLEADICIMHTAQDAYMRKYELWIPGNCTTSRAAQGVTTSLALMKRNLKAETRHFRGAGLP